jgi:hypothetical protein
MIASRKVKKYPLRIPSEVAAKVDRVALKGRTSFNWVVVACVQKGLAEVEKSLAASTGRITNVDPWPKEVARRIYSQPDDDADQIAAMMARQSKVMEE